MARRSAAVARSRGEAGRLGRDGAAPVRQLAQLAVRGRLAGHHERCRVVAHERAARAPAPRLQEPRLPQDLQRLAERHRRHSQLRGQLDLAGQALAWREDARADSLAEAAHDLLDGTFGLQRRKRDVAGGYPCCHLNLITSR